MDKITRICSELTGVGVVASLTFETFAVYANILGLLGMILVLGPHLSFNVKNNL